MKATATSFSTPQDIAAYKKCRAAGHSDSYCTSTPGGGDNGVGAWGDDMTVEDVAYCALPPSAMKTRWGSADAAYKKKVLAVLAQGSQKPFTCIVGDKGPLDIIDLNPGSLIAAGLAANTELSCDALWEWADDEVVPALAMVVKSAPKKKKAAAKKAAAKKPMVKKAAAKKRKAK